MTRDRRLFLLSLAVIGLLLPLASSMRVLFALAAALLAFVPDTTFDGAFAAPRLRRGERADLLVAGGAVVVVAGVWAFWEWPAFRYFSLDDNHAQYLPVLVAGMRQFWTTGRLLTWTPHLGLGMPLTSGGYGLTYPPLHLAFGLAKLSGNEARVLEFNALLHLSGAAGLLALLLRRMRLAWPVALAAGVAFPLGGFIVVQGRIWYQAYAWAPYLVLLLWSVVRLGDRAPVGLRWLVATGASIGLLAHVGHAQNLAFAVLAWGVGVVVVSLQGSMRTAFGRLTSAAAALASGVALALPLLWVEYLGVRHVSPSSLMDDSAMLLQLPALFIPFGILKHLPKWDAPLHVSLRSYFGGLFSVAALVEVWAAVRRFGASGRRSLGVRTGLAVLFVVFGVLAFGRTSMAWELLHKLPGFSRFRFPERFAPIVYLTGIVAGALVVDGGWKQVRWHARPLAAMLFVLVLLVPVLDHPLRMRGADQGWQDVPFAPLPDAWRVLDEGKPGRIAPVGPYGSPRPAVVASLVNNYPILFGQFSASRYNQRVTLTPALREQNQLAESDVAAYAKRWGIRWVLAARPHPGDFDLPTRTDDRSRLTLQGVSFTEKVPEPRVPLRSIRHVDFSGLSLVELHPDVYEPLAHCTSEPARGLPLEAKPNGLDTVACPGAEDASASTTLSFLFHPWLRAFDEQGRWLTVSEDEGHRLVVQPLADSRYVRVRFAPPWWQGWCLAALTAIVSLGLWRLAGRRPLADDDVATSPLAPGV